MGLYTLRIRVVILSWYFRFPDDPGSNNSWVSSQGSGKDSGGPGKGPFRKPAYAPGAHGRGFLLRLFFVFALHLFFIPPVIAAPAHGDGPVVDIEIKGVEGQLLENIKGYLRIYQKRDDPHFNLQWLRFLHRKAPQDIRKALEPFGYFSPRIKSSLVKEGDDRWKAVYVVEPGSRVVVRQVDIKLSGQGKDDQDLRKLVSSFPLKPGDYLDQDLYEKAKKEMVQLALSKGFVDVRAETAKILVDPAKGTAIIRLHIDTGHKYYLGKIRFHQDFMDPGLLKRYLREFHQGDIFTDTLLLEMQQELSNTGFFSLVDVKPALDEVQDWHIPVDITLLPASRNRFSFGFGYDNDIGPKALIYWHNSRLNSLGHTCDAWFRMSTKKKAFKSAYWIPAEDPRTDRYGILTNLEYETTDDTKRYTADLDWGYYFLWKKWSSKLFLEGKMERFLESGESWTLTKMFSLGGRLERSSFPKKPFPRSGWYLYSELRGAAGLVSDTAYIREHLRARYLVPVGSRGRILLKGRLGLAGVTHFSKYPTSLKFFAGGDESVRGFRWKELGPKDSDGDVEGGRNVISGTWEFDYRVLEKWVAALFVDAGNAFNGHLEKIYVGTGIGGRYLTSVGSVRLDFAWPVNEDGRGMKLSSMKFYFGFEITM